MTSRASFNLVSPCSLPLDPLLLRDVLEINFPKLINYSCSSYPTGASCSGQVDGFRNPIEKRVENHNTACVEIISNTDANFLNLHIDKARKTHDDK